MKASKDWIKKELRYVCGNNFTNDPDQIISSEFITKTVTEQYPWLEPGDIIKAFETWNAGKLGTKIKFYGKFANPFVCSVLNAYGVYKRSKGQPRPKSTARPLSPAEKARQDEMRIAKNIVALQQAFEVYKETGKEYVLGLSKLAFWYDFLIEMGLLPKDEVLFDKYVKQANRASLVKQGRADATPGNYQEWKQLRRGTSNEKANHVAYAKHNIVKLFFDELIAGGVELNLSDIEPSRKVTSAN